MKKSRFDSYTRYIEGLVSINRRMTLISDKTFLIYKTTNLLNGKIYIGKHITSNIDDGYMGSGKLLLRAIKKYGVDNFKREILFSFDNAEAMNLKESEIVTPEFVLLETNYNLCPGGNGGFGYINSNGLRNSEKQRESARQIIKQNNKNSDPEKRRKKGQTYSQNYKAGKFKRVNPFLNKHHSDEFKERHSQFMSENQAGTKNSQFGTMWITNEIESRKIKNNSQIPDGWRKGRKIPG